MVAISVYRGNLHRVPDDVPRRWRMPPPRFSLSDFRSLLHRRSAALNHRHHSSSDPIPNPNHDSSPPKPELTEEDEKIEEVKDEVGVKDEDCEMGEGDEEVGRGGDEVMREEEEEKVLDVVMGKDGRVEVFRVEETATATATAVVSVQEPAEGMDISDTMEETRKRKREVEEKLQLLNAKKHNLVQALKQILNAEEELKRRSTSQAIRPPIQLQVDVIGAEDAEADDKLINNQQSRSLLRMNCSSPSPSPSSDSALRRTPYFQHNMATNTPRAGTAATPSPSRFAQYGNPGQSANPPTISIPGANYIASSPSPAASGGTPGFSDARHLSPWG
ncbi:hypothetical protein Drorol1_Dr00021190 [Drosera rotundifolia]